MIQNLFFFFFFFFFFRGVGSLSQPRLNIFTVDNMGVMICLRQGGLRSLSASSLLYYCNYVRPLWRIIDWTFGVNISFEQIMGLDPLFEYDAIATIVSFFFNLQGMAVVIFRK